MTLDDFLFSGLPRLLFRLHAPRVFRMNSFVPFALGLILSSSSPFSQCFLGRSPICKSIPSTRTYPPPCFCTSSSVSITSFHFPFVVGGGVAFQYCTQINPFRLSLAHALHLAIPPSLLLSSCRRTPFHCRLCPSMSPFIYPLCLYSPSSPLSSYSPSSTHHQPSPLRNQLCIPFACSCNLYSIPLHKTSSP